MLAELSGPIIVSRWFHLAAAIIALGGLWFLRVVLLPFGSIETTLPQAGRSVLRRWAVSLHVCILALIVSGVYNSIVQLPLHRGRQAYVVLWLVKVALAVALFFLAAAVTGSNPKLEKLRRQRKQWVAVCLLLGGAILLISNILRSMSTSVIVIGTGGF